MRNIKILKSLTLLIALGGVLVLSCGYLLRQAMWRQKPSIRKTIGAYYLACTGELRGLTKDGLSSKLGAPDRKSDRYAILLLRDNSRTPGMTADLVVKIDARNLVTDITYAWKDFHPERTNRYDPESWSQSDNEKRISMTSDLILRWRGGELRETFPSLSQLEGFWGKLCLLMSGVI